jgi:YhcH/YjgK/YiaL family protein
MIYDQIKHLSTYKGISENIDAAIDYVLNNDIRHLQEGKYSIVGEVVRMEIQFYDTKDPRERSFEAHRRHIDIHFLLSGTELCYTRSLEGMEEKEPFLVEEDYGFYKDEEGICLPLSVGMFALFFPWDAHKACCDLNGKKSRNHKIVLKISC